MAGKEIAVKKYVVKLSAEERAQLESLIHAGKSRAQLLTRARILLSSATLETSINNIGRLRRQLVEEGFEATLSRKYNPNSARPRITLTHHPHVHCIVPGGGLGPDGSWIASKPNFFLPVHVLSRCFRRLFLGRLRAAFDAGRIAFVGELAGLSDLSAFAEYLEPLSKTPWIVFAKRPFAGPSEILDYLARYTHRVAIANGRLLDCRDGRVSFRWKDYRAQNKSKAMTLDADEFTRRFLLHVLPKGFRRIRHFGFLANACRVEKLARIRAALAFPEPERPAEPEDYRERCAQLTGNRIDICPFCGGRMVDAGSWPHPSPPRPTPRCDTS